MSKNNPASRGKAEKKKYNGKIVKPVKYIGTHIGHGSYMAVQYEEGGAVALDNNKKPLMWDAI